jgi:hypothetical protein
VQFTASSELHDKLERLSALMPGVDLASMVEAAVTEKLPPSPFGLRRGFDEALA